MHAKVTCTCGLVGRPCPKCVERERVRRLMALRYYRGMAADELARLIEATRARLPLMRRVLREKTK